jgi:hypothetical protein
MAARSTIRAHTVYARLSASRRLNCVSSIAAIAALVVALLPAGSCGWWAGGHGLLTKAAIRALPAELPAFLREGGELAGHAALDPDIMKNMGLPMLRAAQGPEHYIDWELLQGHTPPPTRWEYMWLCCSLNVRPDKAGMLPYAVAECVQELAMGLAEYRAWPNNRNIQVRCLIYAGHLAHYAQQTCQPLHLTIDYDGRTLADGSSPKTGIHQAVDGLPENLHMTTPDLAAGLRAAALPPDSLLGGVLAEIVANRRFIDTVYALEKQLMAVRSDAAAPPAVTAFAYARCREAVRFTASLYLTAWRLSATVPVEKWLDRSKFDAVR